MGAIEMLSHALARVPVWRRGWSESGGLVLLLDFDGTLAPIADRPELAAVPPRTRAVLERLRRRPGVRLAIVSGRGVADVRERAALAGIAYAGNHGMEIDAPGVRWTHPEARAARPALDAVARRIAEVVAATRGAFLEDKGLTLSIHLRQAPPELHAGVRRAVECAARAEALDVTLGKSVVEVRPRVAWSKGEAVLFLLERAPPPAGAPVLYLGDDRTDEAAFRVLARRGAPHEGVRVGDPAERTAAGSFVRDPAEVAELLGALAG